MSYTDYASRVMKSDVPDDEKGACVRWAAARTLMDAAEREVETLFMARLKEALAAFDFDLAEDLIRRCPPGTVTKVFMLDQLREARKAHTRSTCSEPG